MLENVGANEVLLIASSILNKEFRPFLAKWDLHINREKVFDEDKNIDREKRENLIKTFQEDYNRMVIHLKNKDYLLRLGVFFGLYLGTKKDEPNIDDITDKAADSIVLPYEKI